MARASNVARIVVGVHATGYEEAVSTSKPVPKHIPAMSWVQPDAPTATQHSDPDLADGPPSTDDEGGLETTDGG
jgi:hypothetical protein